MFVSIRSISGMKEAFDFGWESEIRNLFHPLSRKKYEIERQTSRGYFVAVMIAFQAVENPWEHICSNSLNGVP